MVNTDAEENTMQYARSGRKQLFMCLSAQASESSDKKFITMCVSSSTLLSSPSQSLGDSEYVLVNDIDNDHHNDRAIFRHHQKVKCYLCCFPKKKQNCVSLLNIPKGFSRYTPCCSVWLGKAITAAWYE